MTVAGGGTTSVALTVTVEGAVLPHGGDDDSTRGTRLHWFDSTLGLGGDTVPAPYTPIKASTAARGYLIHASRSQYR